MELIISENEESTNGSTKSQHAINHRLYEDALTVRDIVESLRADVAYGPAAYWKESSHYFNKIDNHLSVLVCTTSISEIYQRCFPEFLYVKQEEIELSPEMPMPLEPPSLLLKSSHSKSSSFSAPIVRGPNNHSSFRHSRRGAQFNAFHTIQSKVNETNTLSLDLSRSRGGSRHQQIDRYTEDFLDSVTNRCTDCGCCEVYIPLQIV